MRTHCQLSVRRRYVIQRRCGWSNVPPAVPRDVLLIAGSMLVQLATSLRLITGLTDTDLSVGLSLSLSCRERVIHDMLQNTVSEYRSVFLTERQHTSGHFVP